MKELAEVRTLKEGRYVVLDEEPCTITSMTTSKPGKHGAAKARIEGIGVFDGQKRTAIHPVTAKIYVPVIERKSGQVLSVSGEGEGEGEGDTAQIMDLEDYSTVEIKIPGELREKERGKVDPGKEISFLHYEGQYKIV
ncbi:MAG: translation initiation factor IF-5A [Candidatus Methanophagaceae archaeon]|nr:MAG: translation initiation factor IF-5A [Methanophagales archaeon]HDN68606.1 translation initiation factor IF-5A [Methanomicrobia archaeon]